MAQRSTSDEIPDSALIADGLSREAPPSNVAEAARWMKAVATGERLLGNLDALLG